MLPCVHTGCWGLPVLCVCRSFISLSFLSFFLSFFPRSPVINQCRCNYSKHLYSTVKFTFLSSAIEFPYTNSRKLKHVRKLSLQKIHIQTDKYSLFIVNLRYISVNTTIRYMYLLQYNIYNYSSYMFQLL
jgi:hypothetical protein